MLAVQNPEVFRAGFLNHGRIFKEPRPDIIEI